jgi:pimeloyl-ACP methyl ester carboxylesterase
MSYSVQGRGPGLLLVHGFAGDRTVWSPVRKCLRNDFTIVSVDLPGCGSSGLPPEQDGSADFKAIARHLTALVHELGLQPSILVGHSMGAFLGALAVIQEQDAFAGLVVVDQTFRPSAPVDPVQLKWLEEDARGFLTSFLGIRCWPDQWPMLLGTALAADRRALASYLRHLGADDLGGRLDSLGRPLAVFTSETPPVGDVEMGAWLAARGYDGKGTRWVEGFPACRHWIMLDDPEGFAERLRRIATCLAYG